MSNDWDQDVPDAEIVNTEAAVTRAVTGTEALAVTPPTVIEAITRSQVMTQVDVAKRHPRSVAHFQGQLESLACKTQGIAQSCFYMLPGRGGSNKPISGPSIRMAEIMAASWGNLQVSTMLVDIGDTMVTVRATVWDMQSNVACSEEYIAPIVGKNNRRYSNDMIGTTIRAAMKKALRNAIFTVVPKAYYEAIKEKIQLTAIGQIKDLGATVRAALKWWLDNHKITEQQILRTLRRENIDQIDASDILALRGFTTAVKEDPDRLHDIFEPAKDQTDSVLEKIKDREAAAAKAKEEAEAVAAEAPKLVDQQAIEAAPAQTEAGKKKK